MAASIIITLWLVAVVALAGLGFSFLFGWASLTSIRRGVAAMFGDDLTKAMVGR
jgi:hypothetical protein